jgi:hypothetical protein
MYIEVQGIRRHQPVLLSLWRLVAEADHLEEAARRAVQEL